MMKRRHLLYVLPLIAGLAFAARWLGVLPGSGETEFALEPGSLDFGSVPAQTEVQRVVIATNFGTKPLAVTGLSADAPFKALARPFTLAPGESRDIMVRFLAREPWAGEGKLRIEGEGFAREVQLFGGAHAPAAIEVEPLSLSFGQVEMRGSSKGTITIRNPGGEELRVESLAATGPFKPEMFSTVVPAGGSQTLEVRFSPTGLGRQRSELTIASSDPEKGVVTVQLDGMGVAHAPRAAIEVSPPSLDFGKVALGGSAEQSLSIRNNGTEPLSITNLVLPPPFSALTRGRDIDPGTVFSLPVTFSPPSEGASFAPLVIYSNDPRAGVVTVSLLGEGTKRAGEPASARGIAGRTGGASSGTDVSGGGFAAGVAGTPRTAATQAEGARAAGAAAAVKEAAAPPTPPGLLEGSRFYLGSYGGQISAATIGQIAFDPSSGLLSLTDVQLPPIDAAMGATYSFSPTAAVGHVDPRYGEAEISLVLELIDQFGQKTPLPVKLTTGTSTAVLQGGTQVSVTGKPVDANGIATFVATQTVQAGDFMGLPIEFEFKVKVR